MHELLPAVTTMALLVNQNNPIIAETEQRNLRATARILGLQLEVLNAGSEHDFEKVFARLVELRAGGLVISTARQVLIDHMQEPMPEKRFFVTAVTSPAHIPQDNF
jgi:hypothetical protein